MIDLTRSLEDRQDSANLQIAILSFINVIINYKAGEVSLAIVCVCGIRWVSQGFAASYIAVTIILCELQYY